MTDPHDPLLDEVIDKVITEMFAVSVDPGDPADTLAQTDLPATSAGGFPPFVAPEQVGPYPVTRVLGEGGLGVILMAKDPRFGRPIAIKLLREQFAGDQGFVDQFLREAKVTGNLQHPGVVPIHDIGRTDAGVPYFAMKVISGQTLKAAIRSRDGSPSARHRLLSVFGRVCETVAFAHSCGIVHRDLKPDNIMVGTFGEVQVLDWGLACVDRAASGLGELPPHGEPDVASSPLGSRIFGTPAYMAPEQARGDLAAIDARTDVFALGAILTEILTGDPPYVAGSADEIYLKARRVWLEDAFARLDASDAAPPLVDLARRCLAPESAMRPSDANAVGRDVEHHLAWLENRSNQLKVEAAEARGRTRLAITVGAATTVLMAAVIFWLWSQGHAQTTVREALEHARVLAKSAEQGGPGNPGRWSKAISATEQVVTVSDLHGTLQGEARHLLEVLRAEEAEAERLQQFLNWVDESRLRLVHDLESDDLLEQSLAAFAGIGLDLLGADVSTTADLVRRSPIRDTILQALDLFAFNFRAAGADRPWRELLEIAMAVDDDAWRNAIRTAFMADDLDRLLQLASSSTTHDASAEALDLLARGLRLLGNLDAAIGVWRVAMTRTPLNARIVDRFERVLWLRGAPREEILWLNLLVVSLQPESGLAWHKLAVALRLAGHPELADSATQRGTQLDPSNRWVVDLHRFDVRVLESQGFLAEATDQLAARVRARPRDQDALFGLGKNYYLLQCPQQAVEAFRRTLETRESAQQRCNLGLALSLAGDFQAAIGELERGQELGQQVPGWPYNVAKWLDEVRRLQGLALMLPDSGMPKEPEDPEQRAMLASVALLSHRPWTALRLFRSAFAADAELEHDCGRQAAPYDACFRLRAAESAVQVAAGNADECPEPSEEVRRESLGLALGWLLGELPVLEENAVTRGSRRGLRQAMARLLRTPLLAPVRPGEGLEQVVPVDLQQDWRAYWRQVEQSYRASAKVDVGGESAQRGR